MPATRSATWFEAFLSELRTKGLDFALDAVLTAGVEQAKAMIDRALDDATMTAGFREKASTAVTEVMDAFSQVSDKASCLWCCRT